MKDGIVTLTYGKIAHLDATTGPTDWAGRSIELERKMGMQGHAPAPPRESRRPGEIETTCEIDATTGATVDATTGATPGVSAACKELGMASLSDVIADMGIKPPGQA